MIVFLIKQKFNFLFADYLRGHQLDPYMVATVQGGGSGVQPMENGFCGFVQPI